MTPTDAAAEPVETKFSATVHVDFDGQPIYRLHIDPRCLTIAAERGLGPKLHLNHHDDCRCGDMSARLVERNKLEG